METPFEIVVLSGKGGTGKTCITAAFASLAKNTVFADCDVDAANLHLLFSPDVYQRENMSSGAKAVVHKEKCTVCGLCTELCRFDAIRIADQEIQINEFSCEGCRLCSLACPVGAISIEKYERNQIYLADTRFGPMVYGKLGIAEENSGKLVSKIRHYAKDIAQKLHSEMIITDGPPGIGCPVISSVTGADLVVAVTEPTLSGWYDLERLISLMGQFHTPVKVIINKYDLNEEMCAVIENALDTMKIEVLGKIPYDTSMINSLLAGETIFEYEPEGVIAAMLNKIWHNLNINKYETKCI